MLATVPAMGAVKYDIHDNTLVLKEDFPSKVRELLGYDISIDMYIIRFDISDGKTQIYQIFQYNRHKVDAIRKEAYRVLKEEMTKKGISYNNLIYLPIPKDYVAPL